jgi:hypothetical protein
MPEFKAQSYRDLRKQEFIDKLLQGKLQIQNYVHSNNLPQDLISVSDSLIDVIIGKSVNWKRSELAEFREIVNNHPNWWVVILLIASRLTCVKVNVKVPSQWRRVVEKLLSERKAIAEDIDVQLRGGMDVTLRAWRQACRDKIRSNLHEVSVEQAVEEFDVLSRKVKYSDWPILAAYVYLKYGGDEDTVALFNVPKTLAKSFEKRIHI